MLFASIYFHTSSSPLFLALEEINQPKENIMKNIYLTFIIIAISAMPACSVIEKVQEKSSESIAKLIKRYCSETDKSYREQFRERINLKLAGQATIEVDCNPQLGAIVNDGNRSDFRSSQDGRGHAHLFYRVSPLAAERPFKVARNSALWRPQKTGRTRALI